MIRDIEPRHYDQFLKLNEEFVHWLAPMDRDLLIWVLKRTVYARQIDDGAGIFIGYPYDVDYPDHKNIDWLSGNLSNYFYIDRIIIAANAQGKGLGQKLYQDMEDFARERGYEYLACEVNTKPDNPGSHQFHLRLGFEPLGDQDYPKFKVALRYYAKKL